MKVFSRLTAITLSLAMIIASVFSVGVFADAITFTDVASDYQFNQAIYALVAKGIINGYTEADGTSTFKPENTITRAEFAKLLILATTTGVTHTATTDRFPDLALDHWANTYIAAAVNTGAINGYEDGTFRPENPVSYGEAVKMIVCTLGYASLVPKTEPWFDGYIRTATSIGLLKGAAGLGSNEAKRGLVAQLIFNVNSATKLIQTGTDANGNPIYRPSNNKGGNGVTDEETEEDSGVVTGVFEETIEGISYGLNKEQIMIDDEVYNIGEYDIDSFYSYLGKEIDFEYTDGTKKTIVDFSSGRNDTLTVNDYDFDNIDGRKFTYYEGNKKETIDLSEDLYVVYNGRGVKKSLIDDDFIAEHLDVDCGEIKFLNNDGKSDYDVAFVTNYQTMFVTSKSSSNDVYTIHDKKANAEPLILKNDDCTVYRVSSKGATKTKVDSLSSISNNSVISVAAPLGDDKEGTEVVISGVKLTGKSVESVSKYGYTIDGDEYELSDYYKALIEADAAYELEKGDAGTFYFDFLGKLVYYTKSETTEPYGYLAAIDQSGSGLSSSYVAYIFTQSGSWLDGYAVAENIKINGKRCSPSEARELLEESAAVINAGKRDDMLEKADCAQLIKYKTEGNTVTEITTINPDNLENGSIVPGTFNNDDDTETEAAAFIKEDKLEYARTGSAFKDITAEKNQFTVNSSTIVFFVPFDRSEKDDYKKRTYSTFNDGSQYYAEPYDMSSTNAKVIVVYAATGSTNASIYPNTNPFFIEEISKKTNKDGYSVDYITYYAAGSTSKANIYADKKTVLADHGIQPGDVVKFAIENGEVCNIQKVFVGGELYDFTSAFVTEKDDDNIITHKYNSDEDYYQVVYGKAYSKTEENDQMTITPLGGDEWISFKIDSSTKFYAWDDEEEVFNPEKVIEDISTVDASSEDAATEIVAIKMGDKIIAIYILE